MPLGKRQETLSNTTSCNKTKSNKHNRVETYEHKLQKET